MMLLPKKVGTFTLMRRLGADGATESYTAILDDPAGKQVVARRIEPWLRDDPRHRAELEGRVRDLKAVRHPTLISTLDLVSVDEDQYILSDWVDGVSLRQVLFWCIRNRTPIPPNIYLDLATRICNGLEALHSRPGSHTGAEHVLHLGLSPECVIVKPDGTVAVGVYGLVRAPTVSAAGATAGVNRIEYLSPEQTHPDQGLLPAADIFSLGALLYEALTLKPLFKAGSRLQTMHRIRRAEVTTQLLEVKELLPGLDKVLYRALSLNPRHRYQRAFVLREDLRGLMAGYSFADIEQATQDFLAPLIKARLIGDTDEVVPNLTGPEAPVESTDALLETSLSNLQLPPGFFDTAPRESGEAGELDPIGKGFVEADTGALLRRTNVGFESDDESSTDVRELLQVAGAGTPLPPTRRPSPVPTSVAPAADDTQIVRTTPPIEPQAETPAEPPALEVAPVAQTPAPPAEPTPPVSAEPAPAPREPTPPPPPRRTPPPPSPRTPPPAQTRDDDFDDLDWQPRRGVPPWALAVGGLVVIGGFALVCTGVGMVNLVGALRSPGTEDVAVGGPPPDVGAESIAAAPAPVPQPTADAGPAPAPRAPSAPAAPRERPAPRSESLAPPPAPAPREAPPAMPIARPEPAPFERPAPPPPAPSPVPDRFEDDALALADIEVAEEVPIAVEDDGDLGQLSEVAHAGGLSEAQRDQLDGHALYDADYTRAHVLLYEDARARGDNREARRQLAAVMALPENRYRPEYLVEEAHLALQARDYATALERAELAERHWARLPSELVFSRRAAIFEIEAAALTGLFYASDGEDLDAVDRAIRVWEKYRRHVETRQRSDLVARADERLAQLNDIRRRLE